MATFVPGRPITTSVPRITVDAGLRAGRHLFSLVVANGNGTQSRADEVTVEVRLVVQPDNAPAPRSRSSTSAAPGKTPRSKR